jgi:hypothetical protein
MMMKHQYKFLLLALALGFMFSTADQAFAQDTLLVEWADATGHVIPDILRNVIAQDTPRVANRVYKLQKGGFYWLLGRIENPDFHLRIVGEEPGPTDQENPAVIQMVEDAEGNVDGRIITGQSSVTLKNLWLTGIDDAGVQTYYQPIQMDASNSRFVFENCVLTQTNFALIAFTGTNNDIFYRDCVFRNLIGKPSTQQWEGRGISIWADQDTVVVENCTFFNLGMTAFQLEGGAANYIRFNHNTLVNVGRIVNSGNWFREAYFANNLFINQFWHGEGYIDINDPNRLPGAYNTGMFTIGDLPSMYGPEEGRRIALANCAAWRDPAFADFYEDSLLAQPFCNALTNDFFDTYDQIVAQDTMWLTDEPGFGIYDPEITDLIPDMIQNIIDLRAGTSPATPYFFQLPTLPNGQLLHVGISWPLPEDFSYTNAQLMTAGTDDLPLGDLNWFPTQKALWEANKAQHIADVEALPGAKIELNVVSTHEAEDGTLGGDAAIEEFQGFSYFQMDGGGFIEWVFDLPAAAQYDLNCWTNMRGNSIRGQRIIVNGVSIHDPKGWGEYIWDTDDGVHAGMEINDWTWTLITQANILEAGALTLPAGQNTIRIESSWGWQNFAGWDIIDFATQTTVLELRAPDVTDYSIVTPIGEGAPWTPSGFKSVALNTTGTVTWNINVPSGGTYRIQTFYQNYRSVQMGQFQVDGTDMVTVDFESDPDSTGLNVLSPSFAMSAGAHTLTLDGNGFNVDYVQVIQEIVSSVGEGNEIPLGFVLEQNYPNPFNPTTHIRFSLGRPSNVKLTVYNVLGRKVATLIDSRMAAGSHTFLFDASRLASGLYIYRIEAGDFISQKRMILIK